MARLKNYNLLSQPLDLVIKLDTAGHVIQVVLVSLTVLMVIVIAVFFYKTHSEFWERSHLRHYSHNKQMDIHLVDVRDV